LPQREAESVAVAPIEEVEEEIPLEVLPETYWAWHLTLFLHDDWEQRPDEVALVTHFSRDARLIRLKQQVYDHIYTESSPLFQTRYSKSIKRLPAVRLQKDDGKVIYQVGNGRDVPSTACALGNEIVQAIKERCPFPRPKPTPEPNPTPRPNPTPIPYVPIIDTPIDRAPDGAEAEEETEEEEADELTTGQQLGVLALLFAIAAGGSVLLAAKKDAMG